MSDNLLYNQNVRLSKLDEESASLIFENRKKQLFEGLMNQIKRNGSHKSLRSMSSPKYHMKNSPKITQKQLKSSNSLSQRDSENDSLFKSGSTKTIEVDSPSHFRDSGIKEKDIFKKLCNFDIPKGVQLIHKQKQNQGSNKISSSSSSKQINYESSPPSLFSKRQSQPELSPKMLHSNGNKLLMAKSTLIPNSLHGAMSFSSVMNTPNKTSKSELIINNKPTISDQLQKAINKINSEIKQSGQILQGKIDKQYQQPNRKMETRNQQLKVENSPKRQSIQKNNFLKGGLSQANESRDPSPNLQKPNDHNNIDKEGEIEEKRSRSKSALRKENSPIRSAPKTISSRIQGNSLEKKESIENASLINFKKQLHQPSQSAQCSPLKHQADQNQFYSIDLKNSIQSSRVQSPGSRSHLRPTTSCVFSKEEQFQLYKSSIILSHPGDKQDGSSSMKYSTKKNIQTPLSKKSSSSNDYTPSQRKGSIGSNYSSKNTKISEQNSKKQLQSSPNQIGLLIQNNNQVPTANPTSLFTITPHTTKEHNTQSFIPSLQNSSFSQQIPLVRLISPSENEICLNNRRLDENDSINKRISLASSSCSESSSAKQFSNYHLLTNSGIIQSGLKNYAYSDKYGVKSSSSLQKPGYSSFSQCQSISPASGVSIPLKRLADSYQLQLNLTPQQIQVQQESQSKKKEIGQVSNTLEQFVYEPAAATSIAQVKQNSQALILKQLEKKNTISYKEIFTTQKAKKDQQESNETLQQKSSLVDISPHSQASNEPPNFVQLSSQNGNNNPTSNNNINGKQPVPVNLKQSSILFQQSPGKHQSTFKEFKWNEGDKLLHLKQFNSPSTILNSPFKKESQQNYQQLHLMQNGLNNGRFNDNIGQQFSGTKSQILSPNITSTKNSKSESTTWRKSSTAQINKEEFSSQRDGYSSKRSSSRNLSNSAKREASPSKSSHEKKSSNETKQNTPQQQSSSSDCNLNLDIQLNNREPVSPTKLKKIHFSCDQGNSVFVVNEGERTPLKSILVKGKVSNFEGFSSQVRNDKSEERQQDAESNCNQLIREKSDAQQQQQQVQLIDFRPKSGYHTKSKSSVQEYTNKNINQAQTLFADLRNFAADTQLKTLSAIFNKLDTQNKNEGTTQASNLANNINTQYSISQRKLSDNDSTRLNQFNQNSSPILPVKQLVQSQFSREKTQTISLSSQNAINTDNRCKQIILISQQLTHIKWKVTEDSLRLFNKYQNLIKVAQQSQNLLDQAKKNKQENINI